MASKLFAPFKKLPQQLPIFKKSIDKCKDVSMSNFNSVYGMLDNVTCVSFDHSLDLLALGTAKGEIKIYGSSGMVYTLVNSPLKPIKFLQFIDNQGRLISVDNDNDMFLWEYQVENSYWDLTSSVSLSGQISNGKVTSLSISQPFSWKSDSDDLLELLIVGSNTNKICQILVVGNHFHLYEGNDLSIDSEFLLSKCQELEKDYDFGGVHQISFNPKNNFELLVSYRNGLTLIMETISLKEAPVKECPNEVTGEPSKEVVEEKENEEPVKTENDSGEKENIVTESSEEKPQNEVESEKVEVEQNEVDKEKPVEEVTKDEDNKQDVKIMKESIQVPYIHIQRPKILNYILEDKKVNDAFWLYCQIVIALEESEDLQFYDITGDASKVSKPQRSVTLPDNFQKTVSKFAHFDLKRENVVAFVAQENDKQNLLILMKHDKVYAEIETPSRIIDYIIVQSTVSDEGQSDFGILLIICESQLIAVSVECENIREIQCPYLVLQNTSPITILTGIIQVQSSIFANSQTIGEIVKNWPLKKIAESNEKSDEDSLIDIIGTGHANGSFCIWQVMNFGVLHLLVKVESSDLFNLPQDHLSNLSDGLTTARKKMGHQIHESEDDALQITTMQLMLHSSNNFSNEILYFVVGNASGTALVFKYDGSDVKENIIKIASDFNREGINWIESDCPELLDQSEISCKLPKLNCIVNLNPALPITAIAFQPSWELFAVGCTYGLAMVDLRHSKCVFSHLTIQRATKNNVTTQPPLTVGQQLKKTIRQSFRKLKKLKPSSKHTYVVNEDKAKDKEENKQIEKDEDKDTAQVESSKQESQEVQPNADAEIVEDKTKEEFKDQAEENDHTVIATSETVAEAIAETELITIEISRKDRPITTVGSLLIVNTSLTSSAKAPCLFVGTNIGAIYAFEIIFEGGDDINENILVKLSKELHLQHKAPILLISIVNSNHVPLFKSTDQIGSYQRKFKNADESKIEDEKPEEEINSESKLSEIEIGPSGDSDSKDETKQKSGTLPTPVVQEEPTELPVEGSRRSVDSSKDKITVSNVNMKKSGTLPSSFLQAIGKSQGAGDSHELLVVSQEQVKLFNLPSLKAKYKYKVVDTGHHHFSHSKGSYPQETEQQSSCQDKKDDMAKVHSETSPSKHVSRKISSVGLCKIHGVKLSGKKWNISVALTNGEIVSLQINNLKKYLSDVYNHSTTSIISAISSGELNLIASSSNRLNIQITDFSQSIIHRYEPNIAIPIPKTARPVIEVKAETIVNAVTDTVDETKLTTSEEVIVNGHKTDIVNGHHDIEDEEEKDQLGDETVVQNTSVVHHGDITMDSIKEYITNMDGHIIVKTIESTKEKQVTVDGIGQNTTTIHETQVIGGEVIKDETTVHITSDNQACNELSVTD